MADPTDERQMFCMVGPEWKPPKASKKLRTLKPPYTRTIYNFPQHPGGLPMQRVWFFEGKSTTDCDGSPRAYKADDKAPGKPLDIVANAHTGGDWFGFVTMRDGIPRIDNKGTPYVQSKDHHDLFPGYYVSKTSLQDTSIADYRDSRRYVDPEAVPFVVLPGKGIHDDGSIYTGDGQVHTFNGTQIGDLAYVVCASTRRSFGAVIADGGPANKAGESSIRLLDRLGFPGQDGNNSPEALMQFVYFPNSAARLGGWPKSEALIDQAARTLFVEWGGLPRLRRAFPNNDAVKNLRLTTPGLQGA